MHFFFCHKVEEQRASEMKIILILVGRLFLTCIHESAPERIVVVPEWSLNCMNLLYYMIPGTKLNVMPAKIMQVSLHDLFLMHYMYHLLAGASIVKIDQLH